MPIVYAASFAHSMVTQSAKDFGVSFEEHLSDIRAHIANKGDDTIDLVSIIQWLNELHGRKNDGFFSTSPAEDKGFAAVIAQL